MAMFQPHLETCPICGSTGNCHIHDYYGRSIIDFQAGKREKSDLCVMWVFCDSCEHAHAILPDVIIPYSSYSLLFILRLLGQYEEQVVLPSNNSVKDIKSPPSSSISGLPYGNPTSRNGLVFFLIWILLMFLS